ncbi:hypothetical protein [uncultured Lactobacillus sp.]|uniref:hypothetical protein n=1 Tax=uncultured Lactobacillus sp. TaxID=153152 RepID=UPI0026239A57|nr:hypothetical protein [uncultured Lactobacillus sp.]
MDKQAVARQQLEADDRYKELDLLTKLDKGMLTADDLFKLKERAYWIGYDKGCINTINQLRD